MKNTTLTKTTLPFAAVALLAAPALQAAATFDDFSSDPNIAGGWTEYGYFLNSDSTTPVWNSGAGALDLPKPGGNNGLGLYRTGSSRLATDSVTTTINSLNRTSGGWGFSGLMISAVPQASYVTGTAHDTYTIGLAALGGTNVQYEVRRTYLDGTSNFQLYTGSSFDLATNGPVKLDIERNGSGEYEFLADGNLLYTTTAATTGADFYDPTAKDSLVNYQIVLMSDGAMNVSVDDFGVPVPVAAVPEPSSTALLGLGGLALALRRRR